METTNLFALQKGSVIELDGKDNIIIDISAKTVADTNYFKYVCISEDGYITIKKFNVVLSERTDNFEFKETNSFTYDIFGIMHSLRRTKGSDFDIDTIRF